jgi:hypothetical protein
MEGKVRIARETKNDALEDHTTLTQMMHDMRAAKEEAERQLTQMKKMLEDAKKDWLKKMKDRKNEVQELTRRQEREELKELKRCQNLHRCAAKRNLKITLNSIEFHSANSFGGMYGGWRLLVVWKTITAAA